MNREKARQILGEGATEEQVTNLLNEWHKDKTEEKNQYETRINQLQSDLAKYSDYDQIKKENENYKNSQLTEQEKMAKDKEEIAKNLAESRIIVNTAKAKDVLAGLNVSDTLIAKLVDQDEQKTLTSANELKSMLESQKELVVKETTENLTKVNLNPTISNVNQNDNVMTWDKYTKLSQEEQTKFAEEHPTEFANL